VDPEARADELAVAAYAGDELAGVCTVVIRTLAALRARFAMMRTLVAPAYRDRRISRDLCIQAFEALEKWSLDNPDEKLMGTGVVVQNAELNGHATFGISPTTGLTLVGYTPQGERIRVAWFPHAKV